MLWFRVQGLGDRIEGYCLGVVGFGVWDLIFVDFVFFLSTTQGFQVFQVKICFGVGRLKCRARFAVGLFYWS